MKKIIAVVAAFMSGGIGIAILSHASDVTAGAWN